MATPLAVSLLTTNPSSPGRFLIRKKLGAGSMGIVYEAVDRERDEVVALKTLILAESADLYRFKREFRALADIDHPNLVSLHELFVDDDRSFFTMERIRGVNFLRYVRPDDDLDASDTTLAASDTGTQEGEELVVDPDVVKPPPEPNAPIPEGRGGPRIGRLRTALRGLCEGVAALHMNGKIHRDLKPSNVMVEEGGRVVILDFGLAADRIQDSLADGLTGTAAYMAPEQADNSAHTPASDWYAVGVMLYEALTGRRPHTGPLLHVLMDKQRIDPPAPQTLVEGLPEDLCDLCMRLLSRVPHHRPDAEEVLRLVGAPADTRELVAHSPESTRLVGREAALSQLEQALAAMIARRPITVHVRGPSGAGKSALVRHFLAKLAGHDDTIVLRGRCHVRESVPYKALDGVIDSLSRRLTALRPEEARIYMPRDLWALARLFPVMNTVVDSLGAAQSHGRGDMRAPSDQVELRRRAFASLRELLERLADRRRVVVHIDDLQWSDADSAVLLEELMRPPDPPAVLLILSYRVEDLTGAPRLAALLRGAATIDTRTIELRPLSEDDARALAVELFGGRHAAESHARHIDAIVREADGSPFLIEQLARHVLSGDVVAQKRLSLLEMLESQIARHPAGARELLDTLAVAARPVAQPVALEAARIRGDSRGLVKRLRAANLARLAGEDELELYHDKIREALVADIAATRGSAAIRKIHARLARALLRRGSVDHERLYVHHREAGERYLAATFASRAARRAADALAFDQAANFYRAALELAPLKDSEVVDHRILEEGLGDALANAGRCREAAHAFLRAAVLVVPERALELRRAAAQQLLISGHVDEGIAVLDEVLAEVGLKLAVSPRRALVSVLSQRARLKLRGGAFTERTADEVPHADLFLIDVCWTVSTGLGMIDNTRAAEFQARGLILALEAGEPVRIARAKSMEAAFVASGGTRSRAAATALASDALALATRVGDHEVIALATMAAGACAYMVGEWRRAAVRCHEADVMLGLRCTGVPWQTATTRRFWMSALLRLGEYAELKRCLPEFLRDAEERGNIYAETDFRGRLNALWLCDDDPAGARADIDDVMARWTSRAWHIQHWNAVQAKALADLYEGRSTAALERLARDWRNIKRALLLRVEMIKVDVHELRARATLAQLASGSGGRDRDRLLRAVERDIATLEGMRVPWADPHVAGLRAGLAAIRGQERAAIDHLRAAIDLFDQLDMAGWATAGKRRLGALLGGEEGRELVAQADAWFEAQGVVNTARFARFHFAGFVGEGESHPG
ncbi:MAG: protein kinase [Myxococcales bacterium]|nr:protein kinase [Myxococcales bacterium]